MLLKEQGVRGRKFFFERCERRRAMVSRACGMRRDAARAGCARHICNRTLFAADAMRGICELRHDRSAGAGFGWTEEIGGWGIQ